MKFFKHFGSTFFSLLVLFCFSFAFTGCGIQSLPSAKEDIGASLADIMNQYQRRADLIPNLVNTVKGYASHERETLEGVVSARAKATSTTINANDAEAVAKFQKNQGALSSALSRLMMVVERYPDLKADKNFRMLQEQLEGTENRIAIARQRHIATINRFNKLVAVFPTSLTNEYFFKFEKEAQWTSDTPEAIKQAPKVTF